MSEPKIRIYCSDDDGPVVEWLARRCAIVGDPLSPWITPPMATGAIEEMVRALDALAGPRIDWHDAMQVVIKDEGSAPPSSSVSWFAAQVEAPAPELRCEAFLEREHHFLFVARVDGDMCNLVVVDKLVPRPLRRMYGLKFEYAPEAFHPLHHGAHGPQSGSA